jgi:hypothetical protein
MSLPNGMVVILTVGEQEGTSESSGTLSNAY